MLNTLRSTGTGVGAGGPYIYLEAWNSQPALGCLRGHKDIKEPYVQVIRSGALRDIAWGYYQDCKRRHQQESVTIECGEYSNVDRASDGMARKAIQLSAEGTWTAEWEPATNSWLLTGRNQTFVWNFRLFEITLTVEVLPHD